MATAFRLGISLIPPATYGRLLLVICQLNIDRKYWYVGLQASCSPRCGDSSCSSQLHGMVERASQDNIGFSNLWRGALDIKCARVVDLGYVHENRVTRATNLSRNNPSVVDWCCEVRYIFRNMFEIFFLRTMCFLSTPFEKKNNSLGMMELPTL